jgi:hypothetical protein
MPLTFWGMLSACRSFCEINHKIPGVVDNPLKPVDNPANIGAELTIVNSTRRYNLENIYAANRSGIKEIKITIDPPIMPITSYIIFYSQKI